MINTPEKAIKEFQEYVTAYPKYNNDLPIENFINDMVYGIGTALDNEEYEYADGYDRFKAHLIDFLEKDAGGKFNE